MVTKDEAIKAAETLKEWCEQTPCDQCPYKSGSWCALRVRYPNEWKIPKPRRWSDADVQMAKAMKMYGYKSAERREEGALVVRSSKISWCFFPHKFIFVGLKSGESVSLDGIIREAENGSC